MSRSIRGREITASEFQALPMVDIVVYTKVKGAANPNLFYTTNPN
jgi:hypothetical protein